MKLRRLFFTFLLSLAAFQFCFSQESEPPKIWDNGVLRSRWEFENIPDNEIAEIKKRWEEIGDSLKTTSNPFAGTYYQSGNRGYYLRWSPEKGFVYVYYYEYFVRGVSYGKVSVTDSEITFIPEYESQNGDTDRKLITPTVWIPAYKGKYFIRQKDIKLFGDFYGGFGDFNGFPIKWNCECNAFATKVDKNIDYTKIKSFIVPKKYLKFIKQPINAKIISVGKSRISTHSLVFDVNQSNKASITPVTINIGRKSGIKRGLLFVTNQENSFLEVTKVGEKVSQAILVREIDEKGKEAYSDGWDKTTDKPIYKPYPPIRIATEITTKVDMRIYDRY